MTSAARLSGWRFSCVRWTRTVPRLRANVIEGSLPADQTGASVPSARAGAGQGSSMAYSMISGAWSEKRSSLWMRALRTVSRRPGETSW